MYSLKTLIFILLILAVVTAFKISDKNISTKGKQEEPTEMASHWKFIGESINEPDYDIWGSSPVRDERGNIHLFCARWPSSIPFVKAWKYNSEIAHYISASPEGPFKFVEVIGKGKGKGYWNAVGFHNPNIKKIDNKYVLMYISNDGSPHHGPNQRIGMLLSDSIKGPWKEIPNKNEPLLSPPDDSTIWCWQSGCGVNNPSIFKHPDGKYYLYFKAMTGPRPKGKVSMGVAVSKKLEGPYIIQQNPVTANNATIEDGYAFFWRDHICLLTTDNHGILEKGGGLLWTSKDGLNFNSKPLLGFHNFGRYYLKNNIPKNATVRYTANVKFERPQILMGENGDPEYLYCPSGVAIDGSNGTNNYVLKYD